MVGFGHDLAVLDGEIVVVFTANVQSGISSGAEFHAFDRRDAVDDLSDSRFHTAEHWLAQSGRQTHGGALDDAADTVPKGAVKGDGLAHGLAGFGIQNGKILADADQIRVTQIEAIIPYVDDF